MCTRSRGRVLRRRGARAHLGAEFCEVQAELGRNLLQGEVLVGWYLEPGPGGGVESSAAASMSEARLSNTTVPR